MKGNPQDLTDDGLKSIHSGLVNTLRSRDLTNEEIAFLVKTQELLERRGLTK